ncbi:hypothetical protein LOTGIDRAFT_154843 [Lottia gigantea]|uniref:Uncharacterized protein n=1 Tax=Lottia gigantea TaxID=225164 RepID=V3Z8Y9_LOTGI|nr:hypothetical protein LOTGIDRAFT_154843 [Lottia gigantea]ESO87348.1 hypothetical protein LOTGIDRAFT_154843 [Lottia gigantea]
MEFENNLLKSKSWDPDDISKKGFEIIGHCKDGCSEHNLDTRNTDRKEDFRNCTLQNTFTITLEPVKKENVKFVRYPYVCDSKILDISATLLGMETTNPVFYFKGLDHIHKTINCDCTVYTCSGQLKVEIFHLHGDNICENAQLFSVKHLIRCSPNDVQNYTSPENIKTKFLNIKIRNMTVTGDEVVFFKVHGKDLFVTCTGCKAIQDAVFDRAGHKPDSISKNFIFLQESASPSTTTKKPTPPSANQSTTSTAIQSPTSTANPPPTSTENPPHTSSVNESSTSSSKQTPTSTESATTSLEIYAMFGGILAGIIIINIVVIGIYCFISKREKPPESDYDNVGFRRPDETEIPEYLELNF